VVAAIGHQGDRGGLHVLYETILRAYAHGRETPPLMDIPWEEHWHTQIPELRAAYGVTPFASPYPADILEQIRSIRTA
jgi:hypothetical protein